MWNVWSHRTTATTMWVVLLQLDLSAAFLRGGGSSAKSTNVNYYRYLNLLDDNNNENTCRRRRTNAFFQPPDYNTTPFAAINIHDNHNSCRNPFHYSKKNKNYSFHYLKKDTALFSTVEDTAQQKNVKQRRKKTSGRRSRGRPRKHSAEARANQHRGKSTYTQAVKPVARVNAKTFDENDEEAALKVKAEFAQMEGMLQHRLLTRDEERSFSTAVMEGQRIRNQISSILEERRSSNSKNESASAVPLRTQTKARKRRRKGAIGRPTAELKLVKDGARYYGDQSRFEEEQISEEDVLSILQVPGGKAELRLILQKATDARNQMIVCNLRLVANIAKKYLTLEMNKSGQAQASTFGYSATWNLPSLEELVHEGILGLTRAVDKYDSTYGYKFSTYATYWITSHVRTCLRKTSSGVMNIPRSIQDLRNQYNILIRDYYMMDQEPPGEEGIAEELGVPLKRLRLCLAATQPISSLDGPTYSDMIAPFTSSDESYLSLANIMKSDDSHYDPETHVDVSLLRQSLENAMSSQLSPHERDIIRLRLGLDDGFPRSVKDVAAIYGGDVSKADVRAVERSAYRKLKNYHNEGSSSSPSSAEYQFLKDWVHVEAL